MLATYDRYREAIQKDFENHKNSDSAKISALDQTWRTTKCQTLVRNNIVQFGTQNEQECIRALDSVADEFCRTRTALEYCKQLQTTIATEATTMTTIPTTTTLVTTTTTTVPTTTTTLTTKTVARFTPSRTTTIMSKTTMLIIAVGLAAIITFSVLFFILFRRVHRLQHPERHQKGKKNVQVKNGTSTDNGSASAMSVDIPPRKVKKNIIAL